MEHNGERRLPLYLLLDCSSGTLGESGEALRQTVRTLLADLLGDPQMLETAWLSVIAFASAAEQVCPLTEITAFRAPRLQIGGDAALGAALRLLEQCVEREVHKTTPTHKGDWKPVVYVLSNGRPTDAWEDAAEAFRQRRPARILAIALSAGADFAMLQRLADCVTHAEAVLPGSLVPSNMAISTIVSSHSDPGENLALPPSAWDEG